jgi:hypothetical protein
MAPPMFGTDLALYTRSTSEILLSSDVTLSAFVGLTAHAESAPIFDRLQLEVEASSGGSLSYEFAGASADPFIFVRSQLRRRR